MIILITGASHTGKTNLAQELLKKYDLNYLSLDLLKMDLIRSGYTKLNPEEDNDLTLYLWPIVKNIIKTALENKQSLVIEGGYIPFGYEKYFSKEELKQIKYYSLIFSDDYINNNFDLIKSKANIIENRLDDSDFTKERCLKENSYYLKMCNKYNYQTIIIKEDYINELTRVNIYE